MKVLFAVSDDEISEAIVKEYKEQYKEIITYKNVYYFNAIIKEIERDQTYDRIVISEELEPFTSNNYDAIDKFMFEKLDNISDEITRNTSIVLICIDRRSKGEPLLSKIFGIGLYNALMGNDRNIPEVCRLLRSPRTKKEAKIYYGLGNDEIEYQKETENSVTETEIQNILAHYKRLGKNEEKYIESFNNIAAQYNDTQLRLIIKYLPINVKAVLETQSEKYQSVMTFSESAYQQQKKKNEEKKKSALKMGFIDSNEGKNKLSSPVVVPSAMNKEGVKKLGKKKAEKTEGESVKKQKSMEMQEIKKEKVATKKMAERPLQVKTTMENKPKKTENKKTETKSKPENIVPETNKVKKAKLTEETDEIKPIEEITIKEEVVGETPKRKRGRPRKQVEPEVEQKPKRGRGRPRKNPIVEEVIENDEEDEEDDILKIVKDDDELINAIKEKDKKEIIEDDDDLLPDFEDDDDLLSDFDDNDDDEDEEEEDDDSLLDFDDDDEEDDDDSLLDFDEDDEDEEEDDDSLLDFDEDDEDEEEEDDDSLLDFDDDDEDEDEEDDEEDDDDSLLDFDDEDEDEEEDEEDDDDSLLDFDEDEEEEDDDDSLLDFDGDEKMKDDELLPKSTNKEDKLLNSLQNGKNVMEDFAEHDRSNSNNSVERNYIQSVDFSHILTSDKKIAAFIGTSKNGTSFLVNNLALIFSEMGVKTAILDLTKNKNSYYIFTKNEEDLRKLAYSSFDNLKRGIAQGISVNRNLTVYTALPGENQDMQDVESIIPTLIRNYNVILLDCDFDTQYTYFEAAQEIYVIQSMDILTIQPLTYFLKELKNAGIDLDNKTRIIINKEQKVKNLSKNAIIGGISSYNDPSMSYMIKLFDKDKIMDYSVPLDIEAGAKYLETLATCELSLVGYPKNFIENLKRIASVINPTRKGGMQRPSVSGYNPNNKFSNNMNSTLDEMKRKY